MPEIKAPLAVGEDGASTLAETISAGINMWLQAQDGSKGRATHAVIVRVLKRALAFGAYSWVWPVTRLPGDAGAGAIPVGNHSMCTLFSVY